MIQVTESRLLKVVPSPIHLWLEPWVSLMTSAETLSDWPILPPPGRSMTVEISRGRKILQNTKIKAQMTIFLALFSFRLWLLSFLLQQSYKWSQLAVIFPNWFFFIYAKEEHTKQSSKHKPVVMLNLCYVSVIHVTFPSLQHTPSFPRNVKALGSPWSYLFFLLSV